MEFIFALLNFNLCAFRTVNLKLLEKAKVAYASLFIIKEREKNRKSIGKEKKGVDVGKIILYY